MRDVGPQQDDKKRQRSGGSTLERSHVHGPSPAGESDGLEPRRQVIIFLQTLGVRFGQWDDSWMDCSDRPERCESMLGMIGRIGGANGTD